MKSTLDIGAKEASAEFGVCGIVSLHSITSGEV